MRFASTATILALMVDATLAANLRATQRQLATTSGPDEPNERDLARLTDPPPSTTTNPGMFRDLESSLNAPPPVQGDFNPFPLARDLLEVTGPTPCPTGNMGMSRDLESSLNAPPPAQDTFQPYERDLARLTGPPPSTTTNTGMFRDLQSSGNAPPPAQDFFDPLG